MVSSGKTKSSALGVLIVLAAPAVAGQAPLPVNVAEAKSVALQAVSHMLLAGDAEQLGKLFAEAVAINSKDPRPTDVVIDEFKKELATLPSRNIGDLVSVREILFFDTGGTDHLRKRFPAKTDLWSPKQVPAYIKGGLGCYVVAKELREGREVDDEVYIFVVKKVQGRYRIVYFGNS